MRDAILARPITSLTLRAQPHAGPCVVCRQDADSACERCGVPMDFDCWQRCMTPAEFARWEAYVEALNQPRPLVPVEIHGRRRLVPMGDLPVDDVIVLMLCPGCRS